MANPLKKGERPVLEGYYWIDWGRGNDPVMCQIDEDERNGEMRVWFVGCDYPSKLADTQFDEATFTPYAFLRKVKV